MSEYIAPVAGEKIAVQVQVDADTAKIAREFAEAVHRGKWPIPKNAIKNERQRRTLAGLFRLADAFANAGAADPGEAAKRFAVGDWLFDDVNDQCGKVTHIAGNWIVYEFADENGEITTTSQYVGDCKGGRADKQPIEAA